MRLKYGRRMEVGKSAALELQKQGLSLHHRHEIKNHRARGPSLCSIKRPNDEANDTTITI